MYITATTQNWSKKCCMQYLFPTFNYINYKNKTSIFHLSCSLPTEGTLNPSSDPLSLAHPSPEVPQWWGWRAEHFGHCIHHPGQVPAVRSHPCLARWGRDGQKEPRLQGWLERLSQGQDGTCKPRGSGLSLAQPSECGCKLLLSPAESGCRPCSAAPAPGMLSQGARGAGAGAALAGGALTPHLCLATLGLAAQTGPWLGHGPQAPLLLGLCSSTWLCPASKDFGEQKQDRRQVSAKEVGHTFCSLSLGVSKLGERLKWFKIQ